MQTSTVSPTHILYVYIYWSPSKKGLIVSANRLTKITLLILIATLYLQEESPANILNEDTKPVIRAIWVHTACKYEFLKNIRSHRLWSAFSFSVYIYPVSIYGRLFLIVTNFVTGAHMLDYCCDVGVVDICFVSVSSITTSTLILCSLG